jgi:hypothetical protein
MRDHSRHAKEEHQAGLDLEPDAAALGHHRRAAARTAAPDLHAHDDQPRPGGALSMIPDDEESEA